MALTITKSVFGFNIPVYDASKHGESKLAEKLVHGKYILTFTPPDLVSYVVKNFDLQLPWHTKVEGGELTVNTIKTYQNGQIKVGITVTSPPLVYLVGALASLGLGAYTLTKAERVLELPISYIIVGAAVYFLAKFGK